MRREEVAAAWPEIEKYLSRVEDVAWDLSDVRRFLEDGTALAWGLRTHEVLGFWITRIEETYAHKFGLVWICAGSDLHAGLPAYREVIEPWFWSRGCEWIDINGRKGWKRVVPDYEETAIVLRKYRT